ncbi:MAG: SGNH/GDSL hydrolase family protein [Acidobacteriota bacterium]
MAKSSYRPLLALPMILLAACGGNNMAYLHRIQADLDAVPGTKWEALSQKKVFFGHKSVGVNIVQGLREVMERRPAIRLNIRETADPADFSGPVFAHALIGANRDPGSKIRRFREIMDSGVGRSVDVAFMKLCFVDIDHTTDVEALFKEYAEALAALKADHPGVDFITVTVPLTSRPVGIKARLKRILGRLPWEEADNVKRNAYNDLLRERFRGSLFDLASIESRIDGDHKATFEKDGRRYELLYRPYTSDGGHLNAAGRQIVAIELLRFLAERPGR